jgi:hypothetical protein
VEIESNQSDVPKKNNFMESIADVAEEQLMDNLIEIRISWITRHIMENMGDSGKYKAPY